VPVRHPTHRLQADQTGQIAARPPGRLLTEARNDGYQSVAVLVVVEVGDGVVDEDVISEVES
jgi:hypothetical protein